MPTGVPLRTPRLLSEFAKRTTSRCRSANVSVAALVRRLPLPVVGDLVAEARLDVPVDAVVRDVELAAEVPLRVGKLPLEELVEGLEPGDALASLGLPELAPVALVDVGLGVCLRGEVRRRAVTALFEEERLDRLVVRLFPRHGAHPNLDHPQGCLAPSKGGAPMVTRIGVMDRAILVIRATVTRHDLTRAWHRLGSLIHDTRGRARNYGARSYGNFVRFS